MIVDVHTHAFPDFLATKAMEVLTKPLGDWRPARDGTLATLLASMSMAGVDCCWLASIATRPEQGPSILAWSRQIASDRILPLGSVHPASPTWEQELEAIAAAGLPGIKFHAQFQGFSLDDPDALRVYGKAAELGLFVLFHAGYDIAYPGDERSAPRRLLAIRQQVPGLEMIAAHVGGWQAWDEVLECLVGRDIYLDTSYIHQLAPRQLEQLLSRHSLQRLVFASDSPWLCQREALAHVRALPLDADAMADVLGNNALRLATPINRVRSGAARQCDAT